LSQALWALNKTLQSSADHSPLEISALEVRFQPENVWLDVHEFKALIEACDVHGHSQDGANPSWTCRFCMERLERAAALYRRDFLAGYGLEGSAAFEEWLVEQQEAYREKMIRVCQWLSRGYARLGEREKALQYASRQVSLNPLDETTRRQVIELLVGLGKRNGSLAQYAACRKILAEELGIEPEAVTNALYRQIIEKPEMRVAPSSPPRNLPAAVLPLFGRERELEQICHRLTSLSCLFLTVLGGGGVGKSHLALEAGRLLPSFPRWCFPGGIGHPANHSTLGAAHRPRRGFGTAPR
jgi:DNA-binding SARP family transcriptional activator